MKNILTVSLVALLFLFVNTGCNDEVDADASSNTTVEVVEDSVDAQSSEDTTQAVEDDTTPSSEGDSQSDDVVESTEDVTGQ